MKASEWIDRVKVSRGWDSDYRVAKELGVGRATVSKYRSRESTLDDETAIKVATALGEKPEVILVDQVIERSRNPEVRSALTRVLQRLGVVAAAAVVAGGGGLPSPAQASDSAPLCIMSNHKELGARPSIMDRSPAASDAHPTTETGCKFSNIHRAYPQIR